MSDLLEKITLYDLLGYTLPGGLLLSSICFSAKAEVLVTLHEFGGINGYIFLVLIALSFILGIILSEIAHFLFDKYEKNSDVDLEIEIVKNLKKALYKAGIIKSKKVKDTGKELLKKNYSLMYDDIQTDDAFRRIHNYASAKVMYKNLAVSVFLSFFILGVKNQGRAAGVWIALIGFSFSVILFLRWRRFCAKNKEHVINWFIKKYISGSPQKHGDKC